MTDEEKFQPYYFQKWSEALDFVTEYGWRENVRRCTIERKNPIEWCVTLHFW